MKNTIKFLFLGLFILGITATRAQISTATGGAANVLANAPTTNTNVGIGTAAPTEKLEVVGNIKASGTAKFSSTITASGGIFNGVGLGAAGVTTGTAPTFAQFKNTGGDFYVGQESSTNGGFFTGSIAYDNVLYGNTRPLNIIIGGISRLKIDTSGNVGIGTNTPTNALTVQKISGGSGVSGTDGTGGVRVKWSTGFGLALDAWDTSEPRWGITSFSGNIPTVILEGKYTSKDAYFNSGGNVGIGTTAPAALLDLQKSYGNDVGIKLSQPGSSIWDIKNSASTGLFTIGAGGASYFNIGTNGNVGIGDSNPLAKFVIRDAGQALYFITNQKLVGTFPATPEATTMTITSSGNSAGNLALATGNTEIMRISTNGNVGIGTTDPKNKLSVNGTIWAKEVKVSLTDAADWVFDTNYKLKPLADVEKYIYENKHLPEVPSAEEFRQNDMNVSEMSNKLLQKIEELTLYAIEQQKELERLKTENENYKALATRLSAIEKELKK